MILERIRRYSVDILAGAAIALAFIGGWSIYAPKAHAQDAGYFGQQTYTGDGFISEFSITFPYLVPTDLTVFLNGTQTTAWTIPFQGAIQFTTTPASGVKVLLRRKTNILTPKATFAGGPLASFDLNSNAAQALYALQDQQDALTAGGLGGAGGAGCSTCIVPDSANPPQQGYIGVFAAAANTLSAIQPSQVAVGLIQPNYGGFNITSNDCVIWQGTSTSGANQPLPLGPNRGPCQKFTDGFSSGGGTLSTTTPTLIASVNLTVPGKYECWAQVQFTTGNASQVQAWLDLGSPPNFSNATSQTFSGQVGGTFVSPAAGGAPVYGSTGPGFLEITSGTQHVYLYGLYAGTGTAAQASGHLTCIYGGFN